MNSKELSIQVSACLGTPWLKRPHGLTPPLHPQLSFARGRGQQIGIVAKPSLICHSPGCSITGMR